MTGVTLVTAMGDSLKGDVERMNFSLSKPDFSGEAVCGGRSFKRVFSKKEFPLLGEDEDSAKEILCITARSKERYSGNTNTVLS